MFKPTKKQISSFIGLTALLGIFAILAYAAVFFSASTQPIGYIGQPTLSNYNVTSGQEKIYRGMYNNYDWSGQFSCYPVAANGYVNLAAPCFTAGAGSPLDVQAAANIRLIGTLSDATTPAGVEFSTAGLTTAQQTALGGTANINWIRGTSLSPTGLRARTTVLGDIIHSRPYYWADAANTTPNPTVFVGANDGMLHAFDAATGNERWAYVPSMLITASKMGQLPLTNYVHDYFVDGSMAIGSVLLPGTTTSVPVLVGALGAGGNGLYALSLESLTAATGTIAGEKALWEITSTGLKCGKASQNCIATTTGYANLGDTYSNPVIVPTQDGKTSVIVGNGYNNKGNGHATLYVIDAATGALTREIDTQSGTSTSPNGLSSVTVIDSNGDGKVDRAYAGDIDGNMWVFDLNSTNPGSSGCTTTSNCWKVSNISATTPGTPLPLFTDPSAAAITIAPAVSVHPLGGYMVNFATGRILSQTGTIDDTKDRGTPYAAYGLWDNPTVHTTIPTSSLLTQAILLSTYTPPLGSPSSSSISVITLTTDNKPNWNTNRGWKVPLLINLGGQRVTGDRAFLDNGKFVFNVTNPTIAYTPPGASELAYGENYQVELDYLSGGAGTGPFLDLNQDGQINSSDCLTGTPDCRSNATLTPVGYITSNGVQSQPILIQLASTRISLYNQNYNPSSTGNAGTGVNGGHFDVDILYNPNGLSTPVTCTGGTLSADGSACAGTCTGGTIAANGTSCAVIGTYAPASTCSNSGVVNSANNGCLTPVYHAAVTCSRNSNNCTASASYCDYGVVSNNTCKTPTFTLGGSSAQCTGGTLNTAGTNCTAPGTYAAGSGTYTAGTTVNANFGTQNSHKHEYDKLYDTNGLNFLNPNLSIEALTKGVTNSTTPYKVLVMNQAWNRSMNLRIGMWVINGVKTTTINTSQYQTMRPEDVLINNYISANCTGANSSNLGIGCLDVANLPTYTGNTSTVSAFTTNTATTGIVGKITVTKVTTAGSIRCGGMKANGTAYLAASGVSCDSTGSTTDLRESVGGLELSMPYNGFNIKDWWGTGTSQTGVNPTHPNCPDTTNSDGTLPANQTGAQKQYTGPSGERHDGTLTVQIIRADTPNSDVQMNVPGHPEYGFRVLDSKIMTDVYAEYILYWHHPMAVCMGDSTSTWTDTNNSSDPWWPTQDTGTAATVSNPTTMGILTCSNNGGNGGSQGAWKTTAWAAANTSPYSSPNGSSTNGPAGWTITPPPDSAKTLPPCPTYTSTKDDPRTASFINPTSGSNGSSTLPSPSTAITSISSGMGGNTSGGGGTTGGTGGTTGGNTSTTTASGVPPTNTSQQNGSPPVSGRINWRELIGL